MVERGRSCPRHAIRKKGGKTPLLGKKKIKEQGARGVFAWVPHRGTSPNIDGRRERKNARLLDREKGKQQRGRKGEKRLLAGISCQKESSSKAYEQKKKGAKTRSEGDSSVNGASTRPLGEESNASI